MRHALKLLCFSLILALRADAGAAPPRGTIDYDSLSNIIHVAGFSPDCPGTLEAVYQAARGKNWEQRITRRGKDRYFYTVSAALQIGRKNTSTHFQIGHDAGTPWANEVLVMEEADLETVFAGYDQERTHLSIGCATNPAIRPAIWMTCAQDGTHKIEFTNYEQVECYHAVIEKSGRGYYDFRLASCGGKTVLDNVDLSGMITLWTSDADLSITRSRLHDNQPERMMMQRASAAKQPLVMRDLVITNIGGAVLQVLQEPECQLTLENCAFPAPSVSNAWLRVADNARIVLLNCADSPLTWIKTDQSGSSIVSRKYLVVKVADLQGAPLLGALVTVRQERKGGPAPEQAAQVTDRNGLTSLPISGNAIIVTAFSQTQGPEAMQPATTFYRYTLNVSLKGYRPREQSGLTPDRSWFRAFWPQEDRRETVTVSLENEK